WGWNERESQFSSRMNDDPITWSLPMHPINPAPLRERDITRHIAREYYKEFDSYIESEIIIVGGGPSGLLCARDLAAVGFRTLLIEQSLALGGGFWSGGFLMNKATI